MFYQPCKFAFAKNKFAFTNLKKREGECCKTSASFPQLFFNFSFFFFKS